MSNGKIEDGNIDLYAQPEVKNSDGSISTVDSFSVNLDGSEVLLPTVTADGSHLSEDEALKEYKKTGKHLGKFKTPQDASQYAEQLHNDYAAGKYKKMSNSDIKDLTPEEALAWGISIDNVPEAADPELIRKPYSEIETGIIHGAQGATGGFSDEATGVVAGLLTTGPGRWLREQTGIFPLNPDGSDPFAPTGGGFKEAYKGGTEAGREIADDSKRDNPKVAFVSDTVTSIASPINKIAPVKALSGGTTAAGRIARKVAAPVANATIQGGISGVGYSEGESVGEVAKDAAISAGLSGGIASVGAGTLATGHEILDTKLVNRVTDALTPQTAAPMTPAVPAGPNATMVDPVLPASIMPDASTVPLARTAREASTSPGTEAVTAMQPASRTIPDAQTQLQVGDKSVDPLAKTELNANPLAKTESDKTIVDMTPPPRVPRVAQPVEKPPAAPLPTRDQILDESARRQAVKDRDDLTKQILEEIAVGPDGTRSTATAVKKLDKADKAIAAEVIDGPDAKAVRSAYIGPAKKGLEKLGKVINDVDSQNEKLYSEFTKAGRNVIDHEAYVKNLRAAATAANKAGHTYDVKLIDAIIERFEDMRTRDGGTTVTIPQLRGWTTEVQGQAASAIGALNEHSAAALKARAARIVTSQMYGVMDKAAEGSASLKKAAKQIATNNQRLYGLKTIEENLARRAPKEQTSAPFVQRVVETGTGAVVGGLAGALTGGENAAGQGIAGALIGGTFGSRGRVAKNLGRKAQRAATGRAIASTRDALPGRAARDAADAAMVASRPVAGGTAAIRNAPPPEPEDLSVLTPAELSREIAYASRDVTNSARYRRAIKELQSRK